jgi:hypothetical protein
MSWSEHKFPLLGIVFKNYTLPYWESLLLKLRFNFYAYNDFVYLCIYCIDSYLWSFNTSTLSVCLDQACSHFYLVQQLSQNFVCMPAWVQARTAESSCLQKQCSTQSTARSHSTIKCNLSVTITKSSPWRWPSRVDTCRSVLQLMIKLSLCICWWLVFLCANS